MPTKNHSSNIIWSSKPWITPALAVRSVIIIVLLAAVLTIESMYGIALQNLFGVTVWLITALAFLIIYIAAIFHLLIIRASNRYILRQDGLEVKRGILRLQTFIVTPAGLGDLLVNQSVSGRIFGYGELIVNSQGEKETRLRLVRSPNKVAEMMRQIMGKPIVRLDDSNDYPKENGEKEE